MQMIRCDGKVVACLDRDRREIWRGKLVVEDHRGAHECELRADGESWQGVADEWRVRVDREAGGDTLAKIVVRVQPAPDRVLKRVFLSVVADDAGAPLTRTGNRMLAIPGWLGWPVARDGVIVLDEREKIISSMMTLIVRADGGRAWLFGIGEAKPQDFSFFEAEGGALRAGYYPSRKLATETAFSLVCGVGTDPFALLDAYGDYLKPFSRKTPPPTTGWNSWDYYQGSICMRDLRKEMAAINASPLKDKCRTIVIDLGWESRLGDWKPNRKFPASYRKIAAEIEAAGFVPGIWTTPLLASIYSPIARHRQNLLARRENGSPVVLGENAVLDFSQSAVCDILHRVYNELRKAGFRFFKVDYLYQDTIDAIGRWQGQDDGIGKADLIRRGFETIRAAVGDDSHILNCVGPAEATLGLCDSSRLSLDIRNFWGHIKFNAGQIAARLWQNGKLWRVDPDFAIVRAADTTADRFLNPPYEAKPLADGQAHWWAGPEASFSEMRTWLTVAYLSAGNLFLSDSIARLNGLGLDTLGRLFPPLTESARPLDLFSSKPPRFWLAQSPSGPVLGVFNWSDQAQAIVVPGGVDLPSRGVDAWSGKTVALTESTVMPPHAAILLK